MGSPSYLEHLSNIQAAQLVHRFHHQLSMETNNQLIHYHPQSEGNIHHQFQNHYLVEFSAS